MAAAAKPAATTAPWACCISVRATCWGLGTKVVDSCPTMKAQAASTRREANGERAMIFNLVKKGEAQDFCPLRPEFA
eukprot:CAMPEP_0114662000 /NCGR_PEP_ID=MMETSP0191-20121206/23866_1 /TAXON_ID=126664 /ORGANISM="Sorites sp." /LENGTH=76 /DNA_ID=CAMNT_0001896697 /DNA_START=365 /DNA_END=595 /DNA_ORIENTATION=+